VINLAKMKTTGRKSAKNAFSVGSALILTVVLTSLLAIVGVMFVMVARVDKVATSAISENRELNFAIETIVAKISQELVLDVPGMPKGQEYYDYPGPEDKWLASLEPHKNGTDYNWRQISDVYNKLGSSLKLDAKIVPDYQDSSDVEEGKPADADGDGVADSKWVKLEDITSNKGKPIYAAIRIIDNGGMLNVNTAYRFEPNDVNVTAAEIDGSSQTQIDLLALAERGSTVNPLDKLDDERFGYEPPPHILDDYIEDVVWRYYAPEGKYTPFDISDELKLRNRYILNYNLMVSRIEELWENAYDGGLKVPRTETSQLTDPNGWFWKTNNSSWDVNDYDYRHISTTFNVDRIIRPSGNGNVYKMININEGTNAGNLYNVLISSVAAGMDIEDDDRRRFAQLAVNIVDFIDDDANVTTFEPNNTIYYGFDAQPFITEIAAKIDIYPETGHDYYAVELYNPFNKTIDLNDFELVIADSNDPYSVYHTIGFDDDDYKIDANDCFVIASDLSEFNIYNKPEDRKEDERLIFFAGWQEIDKSEPVIDIRPDPDKSKPPIYIGWINSYDLFLKRKVKDVNDIEEIYVDKQVIDPGWMPGSEGYYGRDVHGWHTVYQTLERDKSGYGSLGIRNNVNSYGEFTEHNFSLFLPNPLGPVEKFITVGDIPRILTVGPDTNPYNTIGEQLQRTAKNEEDEIRLDLQNPYHRNVFQYLTVFDPSRDFDSIGDPIDNDGDGLPNESDPNKPEETPEFKVPGRININTAPSYVMAQLPWMRPEIAQAIVAYRDKLETPVDYYDVDPNEGRYERIKNEIDSRFDQEDIREETGFASIGELNFVINDKESDKEYDIRVYALDNEDLEDFPDLTRDGLDRGDGIEDDFEERDIIFSRISNLVTVRSDVFTVYILVRIGTDGPQKRVVAILDRSDVYSGDGKVRIIALHYVPDPW